MRIIFIALSMTFSVLISTVSFADPVDPKCVKAIASQPFCASRLNAGLYCARNWFRPYAVQEVYDCYQRLSNKHFSAVELQTICIGDGTLAWSNSPEQNKSLCEE